MPNVFRTIAQLAAFSLTFASLAAADIEAGPKGGRLLDLAPHRAEFFVNADRRVEITFYDDAMAPVPPGTQVVEVTAEPSSGRKKLAMEKTPTGFVSREALPPGEPYRIVVQARPGADARPKNFRIDLNLETCAECSHPEYACTCEGH